MLPIQRREEILDFVIDHGTCSIEDLSTEFNVSKVTVHRILNELNENGKIEKVRGGVRVTQDGIRPNLAFTNRKDDRSEQKDAIANLALEYINSGDTIFVDSSTTTLSLIRALARRVDIPLTVISNSPVAVEELVEARHIQFISTGGELHSDTCTYAGDLALRAIENSPFSKAFISSGAFDTNHGIMTNLSYLASVKRRAVECAGETFLLIDSSKYNRVAPLVVAPITSVDRVISDKGLTPKQAAELTNLGVEVST